MSNFLSSVFRKTFCSTLNNICTPINMSKRSAFNRAPKFKPEVKAVNRPKQSVTMSARKEKVEVLSEPVKSISDKKLYKTIRLENGLTALLISDPSKPSQNDENSSSEEESSGSDESGSEIESDSGKSAQSEASDQHGTKRRAEFDEEKLAACALCVGVGSYSDPADIQGLAHFVEHMVFMGSEKYPKENEFDAFIKKKGGSDNASTDCEVTTYYFEIQEKHLAQAMDIFSQFFVSPLMLKEAMQREREAIESEFSIAAPSDSNRKDQLLSSLFPEGHPARIFTWGNIKSLKDDVQDDEKLYRAAHEFRKRHYSAHRMTLAVQARTDLASLEQYVVSTFGQIPNNRLPADDFGRYAYSPDTVTPEFKSIYYVKPISDTTEIHLTWCMRSLISEYESKPHQYISHLLGHEGRGSLLSYLRKKVWALGIYTGNSESGIDYTSMYSLFSAQVVLTKDGLDHIDEVLEAVFSYINMLRKLGPSEQIYEEIKAIEETSFRFSEESQPAEYVETLAENMHFFPPEHYITGDKLYYKYDPKGITELLDCMRADNVNIMILSNKHTVPIQYDAKEKWFGTEYRKEEIPKPWLERWLNVDPYTQFHLPEKNIYITTNFDLVPPAPAYIEEAERLGLDLEKSSPKDIYKKVESSPRTNKIMKQGDLIATVNNFRVWALGIYTGNSESGIDYTSMYSLFSAQVVLTKDGLDHIDEVLEAVFSYINMLRKLGPSEQIYEEIKAIEETSFRFSEESQPAEYVETLAENMHFFPPEHYITGDKLYYKYDPKGITELLDCMRADNVNIMILSNKHTVPIQYDAKEKWFGTEYRKEEIPKPWLERWLNVDPYTQFHLPEKNIYITTNFDLVPPAPAYIEEAERLGLDLEKSSPKDIYKKVESSPRTNKIMKQGDLIATVNNFRLDQPNLLRKNRHMELWYKPDFKFRFPTALLYFYFITPLSFKSPRDSCLIDLWTDVLQQGLKEDVYPANMADLSHSLFVSDKGLTMKVSGYSQNLHLVVDLISREMRTSTDQLTPELFEAVRDVRARSYHNLLLKPHKLAKDLRMNVLLEPYISPRDKAMVIQNITLAELKDYTARLLDKLYLQVLIQGNLPWHEAIKISDNVLHTIKWEGLAENELPDTRVHELPLGTRRVRVRSLNPSSTNSIVANYYQGEPATDKDSAVVEVLMMLMEEPVFDSLRTKEQLGYSVFSLMRYTFGVLGYSVSVNTQVHKFSVSHVDARVEAFLEKFARDMRRLKPRALAAAVHALVQLKHTADYELKEEVERHWREITNGEYRFQRLFTEADAIENVTLSDLKSWVENHFATGNKSHFRKLSVQIIGNKQNETSTEEEVKVKNYTLQYYDGSEDGDADNSFVKDLNEFKKTLPLLVVPKVELPQC